MAINTKRYTKNVPFNLAVLLKKAGYWNPGGFLQTVYNGPCYSIDTRTFFRGGVVADWEDLLPAPTYAEVIDWLMDKGLVVEVGLYIRPDWIGRVWKWGTVNPDSLYESEPGSWSKVINDCIKKALVIVKTLK